MDWPRPPHPPYGHCPYLINIFFGGASLRLVVVVVVMVVVVVVVVVVVGRYRGWGGGGPNKDFESSLCISPCKRRLEGRVGNFPN